MKKIIAIILGLIILLTICGLYFKNIHNITEENAGNVDKIKSVNLSTDYEIDQVMIDIESLIL